MDTDKVARYVDLRRRQKERSAEADAMKAEANDLERELLDDFAEASTDSIRIKLADGSRRTVYLHRQLWAKVEEGVEREAVCDALREAGLGEYVAENFNSNSVSSYLRDLDREAEENEVPFEEVLPVELRGKLGAVEKFSVRDRAG